MKSKAKAAHGFQAKAVPCCFTLHKTTLINVAHLSKIYFRTEIQELFFNVGTVASTSDVRTIAILVSLTVTIKLSLWLTSLRTTKTYEEMKSISRKLVRSLVNN
jgi:hypothetical protein